MKDQLTNMRELSLSKTTPNIRTMFSWSIVCIMLASFRNSATPFCIRSRLKHFMATCTFNNETNNTYFDIFTSFIWSWNNTNWYTEKYIDTCIQTQKYVFGKSSLCNSPVEVENNSLTYCLNPSSLHKEGTNLKVKNV